ncbi:hypothetical protein HO173_002312 [Letharia columbiana]|uniref:Uncharacterized protein n=1 Tax=Letharia columbiana TaxID=112416 RepID=A0A8H6L8K6_9LECA|nr:uncharacterized protein HO173_002312 [Letharia columbiana]KAF6239766.1 hypothetical protein HO173_002312 [Letharia columbiana]
MHHSIIATVLTTFTVSTSATPYLQGRTSGPFNGVATFNDYVDQVNNRNQVTVCGSYNDEPNYDGTSLTVFAAAAGDLSPNISPGRCNYTPSDSSQDRSVCTEPDSTGPDQQPNSETYDGPSCPASCGNCYNVTNNDSLKTVTIYIVDACPALSAYNYCKSNTAPSGKCSGPSNALDISVNAYPYLVNDGAGDGKTGSTTNLENLSILALDYCTQKA